MPVQVQTQFQSLPSFPASTPKRASRDSRPIPAAERRAASAQEQIVQLLPSTRKPQATPASRQETKSAGSPSTVAVQSASGFLRSRAGSQFPSASPTLAPGVSSPHSRTQS